MKKIPFFSDFHSIIIIDNPFFSHYNGITENGALFHYSRLQKGNIPYDITQSVVLGTDIVPIPLYMKLSLIYLVIKT
jgi:hypothetical protein